MAIRDYMVEVSFRAADLSEEAKAELRAVGEICPDDDKTYWELSWDCAANDGKGGFVKDNALIESQDLHSGQYLHDEAEALRVFEQAKKEFASERELNIKAWWDDDAGNGGELAFYQQD